jgi:tryptophan synthase alpha chain
MDTCMNRIDRCFAELAGRKALIPFITAGDPNPGLTVALMDALVAGGADILELGVPFSDPMADGPVIQRASERALVHGVGLRDVLAMVAEFRQHNTTTPVVLMGYLNPVEAMGYGEFAQAARAAGVDGLLTVDCPPEEAEALSLALHAEQLAPIYLIAPTTPAARLADIARHARGYVYYVSLKGVTGAANLDVSEVARRVAAIREHIQLPIGVGFGIRDGQTARQVADVSDAVVIGSRLVQAVENAPLDQAAATLQALLADIRAALDA